MTESISREPERTAAGVGRHKVLIMRCPDYDPARISRIIREGMEVLGVRPSGRVLLKPNTVLAHPQVFPHAFTRPEFLEGVIMALKAVGPQIRDLSVGERSGITVPTRFSFKHAGYMEVLRRHGVKARYFDECRQVPVRLKARERLHDVIFAAEPVMECDLFINLPKFKAHPWTRLTMSLKNLIGIQDDRHRLVDHNSFLEHKIADLQEVVRPGFIAVDAIIAGQKMMLTPTPFPLKAVVMGVNPCAVDTVCCHMVHVEPEEVVHLRMASERGIGPCRLEDIDVQGDFPLEEVRQNTRDFQFCMERIDDYFGTGAGLTCTVGRFPEDHSPDYCWGGCPGALQEAMHIFRGYYPEVDQVMKKMRYVVGRVEGSLDPAPDERVLFAGDCTRWEGTLGDRKVYIRDSYRRNREPEVRETRSNDMILKILGALWHCLVRRKSRHLHVKGCPVSVAQHVSYLSSVGGLPDPNFDPRMVLSVNIAYWQMRVHRLVSRWFG
ncbi:MAG: DUF362 domain-containing protein [Thermodesulfobacteriota bacterium]